VHRKIAEEIDVGFIGVDFSVIAEGLKGEDIEDDDL